MGKNIYVDSYISKIELKEDMNRERLEQRLFASINLGIEEIDKEVCLYKSKILVRECPIARQKSSLYKRIVGGSLIQSAA